MNVIELETMLGDLIAAGRGELRVMSMSDSGRASDVDGASEEVVNGESVVMVG